MHDFSLAVWDAALLALSAFLQAVILNHFYRQHRRQYLRYWALGWLALLAYVVADFSGAFVAIWGWPTFVSGALGYTSYLTGYAHCALLLSGTYALLERRQPSRSFLTGLTIVMAVLAISGALPRGEGGLVSVMLTRGLLAFLTGSAFLVGAVWTIARARSTRVGALLVSVGFGLAAAREFAVTYQMVVIQRNPELAMGLVPFLDVARIALVGLIGTGLIIWLLEEEQRRAIKASEALRQADERAQSRFRRMLERGWDIVELRNHDGEVEWVSQAVARVLGFDPDEYMAIGPLALVHPDDRAALPLALGGSGVRGGPVRIRVRGADDAYRSMEVAYADLTDDPEVRAIVVTSRNVTDRRRLEREVLQISGRERRKLGRELHDGLGQLLTGIGFQLVRLERELDQETADARSTTSGIRALVKEAVVQAEVLARGLSPVAVPAEGIVSALQSLADTTKATYGVPCVLHCQTNVEIEDPESATQVYLIAQEAVRNAVLHAECTQIRVDLDAVDDGYRLSVSDDGIGLGAIDRSNGGESGTGLQIMAHRAEVINAALDVEQADAGGTRVVCRFSPHAVN